MCCDDPANECNCICKRKSDMSAPPELVLDEYGLTANEREWLEAELAKRGATIDEAIFHDNTQMSTCGVARGITGHNITNVWYTENGNDLILGWSSNMKHLPQYTGEHCGAVASLWQDGQSMGFAYYDLIINSTSDHDEYVYATNGYWRIISVATFNNENHVDIGHIWIP